MSKATFCLSPSGLGSADFIVICDLRAQKTGQRIRSCTTETKMQTHESREKPQHSGQCDQRNRFISRYCYYHYGMVFRSFCLTERTKYDNIIILQCRIFRLFRCDTAISYAHGQRALAAVLYRLPYSIMDMHGKKKQHGPRWSEILMLMFSPMIIFFIWDFRSITNPTEKINNVYCYWVVLTI